MELAIDAVIGFLLLYFIYYYALRFIQSVFQSSLSCINGFLAKLIYGISTPAHELAHYFLHKGINAFACRGLSGSYIKNKYERQAYIFAAELLIDDNIHKLYPGESEAQIASRIGVHPWLFDLKFREKLR